MRNRLLIISIAIAVIAGGAIIALWAITRSPKLQNAVLKLANSSTTNTSATNTGTPVVPKTTISPDKEAILFVARNFVERYGSGSNQNAGSNVLSAEAYGTVLFNSFLTAQAKQQKQAPVDPVFHSTVTKALVFKTLKQTATAASVQVSTQQTVTTGQTTAVIQKDIVVDLTKVGANWKVNGAIWK